MIDHTTHRQQLEETLTAAREGIASSGIHPKNYGKMDQWLRNNGYHSCFTLDGSIEVDIATGQLYAWDYHPDDTDGTKIVEVR